MQGMTFLVTDDDAHVRNLIHMYFSREGARVLTAENGLEALDLFRANSVDAVILDVMMPGMDGLGVCREIRKESEVPIFFLTAKGEEIDRILGLELGADDYIVKPFSPRELTARMKAVFRRMNGSAARGKEEPDPAVIVYPGLTIDHHAREVRINGVPVSLAPKEFDLLLFLAQHPRIVFEREQLLERVWGYDFGGETRTVDAHVKKLRVKLGEPVRHYIHTSWGIGYKFEVVQG